MQMYVQKWPWLLYDHWMLAHQTRELCWPVVCGADYLIGMQWDSLSFDKQLHILTLDMQL